MTPAHLELLLRVGRRVTHVVDLPGLHVSLVCLLPGLVLTPLRLLLRPTTNLLLACGCYNAISYIKQKLVSHTRKQCGGKGSTSQAW